MAGLVQNILPFQTLNRDVKILYVSYIFASFGDGLTGYLLPIFIRELNALPEHVGLLYSILTIASSVTIIPGGLLADKYDRRKILLLAWAIWVPVPLFFAFATDWTQLIPAMFLYGIMLAGPTSSAYVIGRTSKKRIASTFATLASAWGIGYMLSPTISGYLASTYGMPPIFYITSIFYFITLLLITRISGQHPKDAEDQTKMFEETSRSADFTLRKVFLLSTLFAAAIFTIWLVLPLIPQFFGDVYGYNFVEIGVLGSCTYFGGSTLSLVVGRIGDKYRKTVGVSFIMIFVALALSMFVSVNVFVVLMFASFLRGASFPIWGLMSGTVGSMAPTTSRARWISVVQTVSQMASVLAPYLGGILYTRSPHTPFFIAILIALTLSVIALIKPFRDL
jgi:MFS family permease